ncbi:MAG: hypothetical protein GY859_04815, partial [Desulfobacterales bacterium]|nr:hypothetical protein [Desulfobacterales bacterium]
MLIGIAMTLLFSGGAAGKQDDPAPLLGKLIRLEVDGPRDVEDMLENFLTVRGFILVGDDHAPVMRVVAEKKRQGDYRECKVSYNIRKLSLRAPGGGVAYSFRAKYAHDYGEEEQAANSALYLLKEYLSQDEILIQRLDEIASAPYYRLNLQEEPSDRKFDEIRNMLIEMTVKLEPLLETREELVKLARGQNTIIDPTPG